MAAGRTTEPPLLRGSDGRVHATPAASHGRQTDRRTPPLAMLHHACIHICMKRAWLADANRSTQLVLLPIYCARVVGGTGRLVPVDQCPSVLSHRRPPPMAHPRWKPIGALPSMGHQGRPVGSPSIVTIDLYAGGGRRRDPAGNPGPTTLKQTWRRAPEKQQPQEIQARVYVVSIRHGQPIVGPSDRPKCGRAHSLILVSACE